MVRDHGITGNYMGEKKEKNIILYFFMFSILLGIVLHGLNSCRKYGV